MRYAIFTGNSASVMMPFSMSSFCPRRFGLNLQSTRHVMSHAAKRYQVAEKAFAGCSKTKGRTRTDRDRVP